MLYVFFFQSIAPNQKIHIMVKSTGVTLAFNIGYNFSVTMVMICLVHLPSIVYQMETGHLLYQPVKVSDNSFNGCSR